MAATERLICAAALVDGGPEVRFEIRRDGQAAPAFAIRQHGRVYAYVNRCSHFGVELDWQPGRFFDVSELYLIRTTHGRCTLPTAGGAWAAVATEKACSGWPSPSANKAFT